MWRYRELFLVLSWRDVQVRYKQTVLGIAWAVLQPLSITIVFSVFFFRLAALSSGGVPYPVFTLAALLPWQLFAAAVSGSSNSLVGSSSLLTKVYFPRLIIPIAAVVSTLADFGISLVLLTGLMAWYRIVPSTGILLLPLFVLQALTLALAIGLWTSALNVQYRDVQYALPFALQVLLFASPVAYSATLVPADANYEGEVAERWRYVDGAGEIGVISSVTQAFCSTCTRMRLSTEGSLFTCLFAQSGHDLKSLLRSGAADEEIRNQIAAVWQRRADRYSEIRTAETAKQRKVEMSYIGG